MSSVQILTMIATLLGGLTFFLFGMNVMSGGLSKTAGGALEKTMNKVSSNDFFGFFLGAGVTVAIQSSSALTVMLVGLVNSGILDFSNTFGMIMGSNVGTTLTAWLLSLVGLDGNNFWLSLLKPMIFAPLLAFFGIVLQMLSKKESRKNLGTIFIGFAVLMTGMDLMSAAMEIVPDTLLTDVLSAFESPIIALLASTVFTGIIQSSAATIGIVQVLALNGTISYEMAIPLVLGANIGTCITAIISCIGTNKNAKRVSMMHILVNVIGSVVCMILIYVLKPFIPELLSTKIGMVDVAIIHSVFNIVNTVILLPVKKPLIKLCQKLVPDKEEKTHTVFLDERLFSNTGLVISECRKFMNEMADLSRKAIIDAVDLVENYSEEKSQAVREAEQLVDKYEDRLGTYLVRISGHALNEQESHEVGRMLHGIGDFERISDHALNIRDVAQEINDKNIVFSDEAKAELQIIRDALLEIVNISVDSFVENDPVAASNVEPLEQVIDRLKSVLKARHVDRLQRGDCTTQTGFVFSDLLTNYERASDHCSNVAVYTIQANSSKLDVHKYLKGVREGENSFFTETYKKYRDKYYVENNV